MYCIKDITKDTKWVGVSDRRLELFEHLIPVPTGISYNSYLVIDEKTVLLDAVDAAKDRAFFENLKAGLNGRNLDYVIMNHMEPDHGATLQNLMLHYPEVTVVGNKKTLGMIKQFFDFDIDAHFKEVTEASILNTGKHTFHFYMAPMVHWPEVMVTYDEEDKVLYSADAFGTFGALDGHIYADELNFEQDWIDEARRYYTNIVGKYGLQVKALFKKISDLEIELLCPLHGPIWRENIEWYLNKYNVWADYQPEEKGVLIAVGSIYGNTENAADILAMELGNRGVSNIQLHDVSRIDVSTILSDCFKYSHLVLASSTYNGEIFSKMEELLRDLKAHNLANRTVAYMENGTWAPQAAKKMNEIVSTMKNMTILEQKVSIKSSLKEEGLEAIGDLADAIVASMK